MNLSFTPTKTGGRISDGDTAFGRFTFVAFESFENARIVTLDGRVVGAARMLIRRPAEHIPASFNPATERQGCCDPPLPD